MTDETLPLLPIKPVAGECQLIQHAQNTHCITVNRYATVDELEDRNLWSFVAGTFKHGDFLKVRSKDMSMFAEGIVMFAQGTVVKVKFYNHFDMGKVAQPEMKFQGFIIRLISPTAGYEIVEEKSGTLLKGEGLQNQDAAIKYLADHFKHTVKDI